MKSVKLLLILVVQASFLEVALAQAIHYNIYVDGNLDADAIGTYSVGNRDNSGDQIAFKTIQEAVDYSIPGDTIGIRSGIYYPTSSINISKSGTDANNPIIICAYGVTTSDESETVIIDGSMMSGDIINVSNTDYIYLRGFTVCNSTGYCLDFTAGSDYGNFYNLTLYGSSSSAVRINDSNNATFQYCTIYNNVGSGILMRGSSYCTIDRNECYNNQEGISIVWHDTPKLISQYNVVSNNLCYNNTNYPEGNDGLGTSTGTRFNTIVNNICWGNSDDGIDCSTGNGAGQSGISVEGYDQTTNVFNTIIGNICFDNGDGAEGEGDGNGMKVSTNSGGGHLLGYNICFDNDRAGFDQDKADGYPANYFYNNIAYHNGELALNNGYSGFAIDHSEDNPANLAVLYNNIALGNAKYDFFCKSATNSVYDSNNNFWADGHMYDGYDGNSKSGDPKFSNANLSIDTNFGSGWTIDDKLFYIRYQINEKFSLDETSPAKNAGKIINGFHNSISGEEGDEGIVWFGTMPDMGVGAMLLSSEDISNLIHIIPDNEENSETEIIDEPNNPDESDVPEEDTGSSIPDDSSITPIRIQPLPLTSNLESVETDSSDSSQEDYSAISPLFGASNEGLHVEKGTTNGVRKIKERRSFNKYDHLYGLAKKGWTKESAE